MSQTPEQIAERFADAAERSVELFIEGFGRPPSPDEVNMLVQAIFRHFNEPNAPTTRLQ